MSGGKPQSGGSRPKEGRWTKVGVLFGGGLLLLAFLAFLGVHLSNGNNPQTSTTTSTPSTPPTTTTPPSQMIYLDQLPVVDGTVASKGSVNATGTTFADGVSISTQDTFPNLPNTVTFQLPHAFSTIRSFVGVDPNTVQGYTGSFDVSVMAGGRTIATTTIDQGTLCTIDGNTDGERTITLKVYQAQNGPGMNVVFGDLRAINGTDFPNEPSANPCP
jgi:hypothetical protein